MLVNKKFIKFLFSNYKELKGYERSYIKPISWDNLPSATNKFSSITEQYALNNYTNSNVKWIRLTEKILEKLNNDERELFKSRYIKELSFKDIAVILNISESAAIHRHSRLLDKGIKILKNEGL